MLKPTLIAIGEFTRSPSGDTKHAKIPEGLTDGTYEILLRGVGYDNSPVYDDSFFTEPVTHLDVMRDAAQAVLDAWVANDGTIKMREHLRVQMDALRKAIENTPQGEQA